MACEIPKRHSGNFFLLENVTFTENNGNPIVRPLVCCSNTSLIEQLADLRCEAYQEMCVKLGMVAGKGQLKLTSTLYDPDNILDFDCIERATRKKEILG